MTSARAPEPPPTPVIRPWVTSRHARWLLATLTVVLLLGPPAERVTADGDSERGATGGSTRVLRTVEVDLGPDGTVEQARRHTRTEGPQLAPSTDEQVIAEDEVPLVARIRYGADGQALAPDDLEDHTGDVVLAIEIRNLDTQPRSITYGTPDGLIDETVEVAAPFMAQVSVELDRNWSLAETGNGTVSVGPDGGTQIRWQAALFPPVAPTTARFEMQAMTDGGAAPRITIEGWPVTTASSPAAAIADDLLTAQATSDAVAAVVAAGLQEVVGAAAAGADGLTDGLEQLQLGIADALDEVDGFDPDALIADALDGIGDQLDTARLVDELLATALPDLPDAQQLAEQFDDQLEVGALLDDAGLGAMFEDVLAQAVPAPEDLDLDTDVLLEGIELDDVLGEVLDELDLTTLFDALLEEIEVEQLVADQLADLDLTEVLDEVLADLDPADLLAAVDLEAALAPVIDELADDLAGPLGELTDPEVLLERLQQAIGPRSLGELIGAAELGPLVTTLLATDDLEVELAALLSVLLDDIGLAVPVTIAPRLDDILGLVATELELVDGLIEALGTATDELDRRDLDTGPGPHEAPIALAASLAERLRATSGVMGSADDAVFDDLDRTVRTSVDRLAEAGRALADAKLELAGDAAPLEPVADALGAAELAIGELGDDVADARERSDAAYAALAAELPRLADELEEFAETLATSRPGTEGPLAETIRKDLDELGHGLARLRTGVGGVRGPVEELLQELRAAPDPLGRIDRLLDDATLELAPAVASFQERAAGRLAGVRFDELPFEELATALDLDVRALTSELVGAFDPPELTELVGAALTELDLDAAALLEVLDLDTGALLAPLIDELPDLTELLGDVDPAPLLETVDVSGLLGPDVAERLVAGLAPAPEDLAVLLAGALDDLAPPEFDDLLEELDLDLTEAFDTAALSPEALLGDLRPPDGDALIDALELQPDELIAELGIDTFGELDELGGELLAGIAGLAGGAGALTEGLELVADDGLAELVGQLDGDNREAQRDLALLRELDERAAATGTGVGADARYHLLSEPRDTVFTPARVTGVVAALALVLVTLLRRRREPAGADGADGADG